MKLNIAGGQRPIEGFINIDLFEGADIVHDLNEYPWPIEDESVEEIMCSHYIEHVPDLMKFMNEIYRILKPEAKATFVAPYYNSMRCWQDPTHVQAISEGTFVYYNQEWLKSNGLSHYPIHCNFDYSYAYTIIDPFWNLKSNEAKAFAIKHYTNVVEDINVFLVKKPMQ
jgi:predicted SAM-dependent methyltransferase